MPKSRTIATLDLGSNSFHMLIARVEEDGTARVIDSLKETVRLREGLREDGSLTRVVQERAIACLTRFEQRLRPLHPDNFRVVGTNTLRSAKNASEFIDRIEHTLKARVHIIGGREEARLIYAGVTANEPATGNRNFIVDIGGGSTEFIIGIDRDPRIMESRPMGCVSYSMQFFKNQIFSQKALDKALISVSQELERYQATFLPENWDTAIGSSGTVKAIGAVAEANKFCSDGITAEAMEAICKQLLKMKKLTEGALPGLKDDRVPVFLGGFAVLYGIFKTYNVKHMKVSVQSLREGVLYDLLDREHHHDRRLETVDRMKHFYSVDILQAERIRKTAMDLFPMIADQIIHDHETAESVLGWAAELHEVGMSIAHHGYHKHGAYILFNTDMDGFTKTEQSLLSFLVLNHRKRLKETALDYDGKVDWPLVFVLRLAVILHRDRVSKTLPKIGLEWRGKKILLGIEVDWLRDHQLTRHDLETEVACWKKLGYKLLINS